MKKVFYYLIILILLIVLVYLGKTKLAAFFYNQGCNYYDRSLYAEAIASFKRSLKINPNLAVIHYSLANAYMEINMEDKAIEEYKKTVQIDPNYIPAYRALSQIYCGHGMYEDALNLLKQAEIKIPANQKIKEVLEEISFEYMADCLNKSADLFLAGDKLKAHGLLNKALEIKPDFAFAHYTLAYFYFIEHNYDEAETRLNRAIQIDSQFWSAHKLLGDVYFEKGIYEKAVINYKMALALNYNDPTIHNDLGLALMQMERYDETLVYLKEASKLDPKNLNIHYNLARVYQDKGMFNEAILEYKKVISYQPDYPNIHNDLGDIYRQQGKDKDSSDEYNKEIEYCHRKLLTDPNNPVILNNLAYALTGIGENDKAKELIEKVITSQPNYRRAHLTLAKIYENLGNFNEAISALNKAKALSISKDFTYIDKDIIRIKRDLLASSEMPILALDTIYLKNGRQIKGRIKEEDGEKVILEVQLGNVTGSLTFYRNMIEQIVRSGGGKN